MSDKVFIAGVGMIPFMKPGTSPHYHVMAAQAITEALEDAGLAYEKVQQAFAGYVSGNSTCGQKAIYRVGMTGIPIFNVNNNCATGSTALFLASQAVASGVCEVALAVGFEQMTPGAISTPWTDRPVPLEFEYVMTPVHQTIEVLLRQGRGPVYVVHPTQAGALERAQASGVAVRVASRCPLGQTLARPGAALPGAQGLSPVKARVSLLLELLAAQTQQRPDQRGV